MNEWTAGWYLWDEKLFCSSSKHFTSVCPGFIMQLILPSGLCNKMEDLHYQHCCTLREISSKASKRCVLFQFPFSAFSFIPNDEVGGLWKSLWCPFNATLSDLLALSAAFFLFSPSSLLWCQARGKVKYLSCLYCQSLGESSGTNKSLLLRQ